MVSGRSGRAHPPDRYAMLAPPGSRFFSRHSSGQLATSPHRDHRMEHDAAQVLQVLHDEPARRSRESASGRGAALKRTVRIADAAAAPSSIGKRDAPAGCDRPARRRIGCRRQIAAIVGVTAAGSVMLGLPVST
ncbi:hypothetical protein CFB49_26545 [Burkholderia sp. AU17457]|nr:hypothetical protein CFB49_26545 [Burkholderia sp. AU17457]